MSKISVEEAIVLCNEIANFAINVANEFPIDPLVQKHMDGLHRIESQRVLLRQLGSKSSNAHYLAKHLGYPSDVTKDIVLLDIEVLNTEIENLGENIKHLLKQNSQDNKAIVQKLVDITPKVEQFLLGTMETADDMKLSVVNNFYRIFKLRGVTSIIAQQQILPAWYEVYKDHLKPFNSLNRQH